jgi:PIN domain nuclease of toxin-antitoxin system
VRLLLDPTYWAAASSKRLPREARKLLEDDGNEVYYSAASIWEIATKSSLRRKDFRIDLARLLAPLPEMGLVELPITAVHAAGVTRLPPIHRDPFDRLLIAQSLVEPLTLLTNDALLDRYRVGARVV